MAATTRLTRDQFLIFLDTARDTAFTTNTWKRVDKSTIFEYALNEETQTNPYIDSIDSTTEVMSNVPNMSQEIQVLEGNPIYDMIVADIQTRPTGEDAKVPYLLCFGGIGMVANRGMATITEKKLNTVDGKASFTLNFAEIVDGTYVVTDGTPVFTEAV